MKKNQLKIEKIKKNISSFPAICVFKLSRNDLLADKTYKLSNIVKNTNKKIFNFAEEKKDIFNNLIKIQKSGFFKFSIFLMGNFENVIDYFKVKIGDEEAKMGNWSNIWGSGEGVRRRYSEKLLWAKEGDDVFLRFFGEKKCLCDLLLKVEMIC